MRHSIDKTVLALALSSEPDAPLPGPLPGLARCGAGPREPHSSPLSKRLREASDARVRALVEVAFGRTGPTAIASQLGVSRAVVRGWAEPGGLCLTLRDTLAAPRGFGRDVLEAALLVVVEDVPDTLDGVDKLASRLLLVAFDLMKLADQVGPDPSDPVRRAVLALLDRIEDLVRQARRKLARGGGR